MLSKKKRLLTHCQQSKNKKSQTNKQTNKQHTHTHIYTNKQTQLKKKWVYWPSFNGAFALDDGHFKERAIFNTVLSLSACIVSTFAASKLFNEEHKLDMVHIQNATLAGGVAVGAAADLYIHPASALGIGTFAGLLSTIGYTKIQPFLEDKISLADTCGVNNLHGMPNVL